MCVVVAKYFDDVGWVLGKNRDRNYPTQIRMVQSNRLGVQRLYIDDTTTRWTEGVNEYGLSILSAAFAVKDDEKDGKKSGPRSSAFMSPDGKKIRTALLEKKIDKALAYLIESQLDGATFISDGKDCYLLEAAHQNFERKDYYHKTIKLDPKKAYVRTNHGILLPKAGYQDGDSPNEKKNRESTLARYDAVHSQLDGIETPFGVLKALSHCPNKNTFLNPIRTGDPKKGDMVTTAQLLVVPKERTLYYRPLYSGIEIEAFHKLNGVESKTFFEVISNRKMLNQSFKNSLRK